MPIKTFQMAEFNKAVLNGTATWWQMELPSGSVSFGEAKAGMLGYPETMFKKYTDFTDLVHPDDIEKTMDAMRDHMSGKKPLYETTYRIKARNGEYIRFYDCGQITKKTDDKTTVTGFVLKVSEESDVLKQMEEFKKLILGGNPSLIELISQTKQ